MTDYRPALAIAGIVLGVLLGRCTAPAPEPTATRVQESPEEMEKERPELETPSLGKKVTTVVGKPDQVRVATAPSAAGKKAVAVYCEPVVLLDRGERVVIDTTKPLTPAALLPDFAGRYDGKALTLFSTLNDGRRFAVDYRPRGHFEYESDGDSVRIRWDRTWVRVVRGVKRCAPPVAGAAGLGALLEAGDDPLAGALAMGLSAAIGCAF